MTIAADAYLARRGQHGNSVPPAFRSRPPSPRGRRRAAAGTRPDFDGVNVDRRHEDWLPAGRNPADLAMAHLDLLQRRSRNLATTAPPFITATNRIVTNVVGEGFRIQPRPHQGDPEKIDERIQAALLELLDEWQCEPDIDGRLSLAMMLATGCREFVEAGEYMQIEKQEDPRRSPKTVPLSIKLINAERLDHNYWRQDNPNDSTSKGNRITNGIEFDADDRRTAYHIAKAQFAGVPQINMNEDRDRIPADRIQHIFRQLRIGQERGLPWLYGAMVLCADLDDLIDAELTSAQVAACLTAFISREGSGVYDSSQERDAVDNRPVHRFEPGMVFDLDVDEKVTTVDPNRPGGTFEPFTSFLLRSLAGALGISYEAISGDYRGVNFASGRLGKMEEQRTFRAVQQEIIQLAVRPVYTAFVRTAILAGKVPGIDVGDYVQNPRRYTRALFGAAGWDHQDPLKEANAAEKRIDIGISTKEAEAAKLGRDWRDILKQKVIEQREYEKAGITVSTTTSSEGDDPGDPDDPPTDGGEQRAREDVTAAPAGAT